MANQEWREVNALRKAGKLDEAEKRGLDLLADHSGDAFIKSHVAWVYHDRIKSVRESIKKRLKPDANLSEAITPSDIRTIERELGRYAKLDPKIPELSHSMLLVQLTKLGHKLPRFLRFLLWDHWKDCEHFREDDYKARKSDDGKTTFPSLAVNVAREALEWFDESRDDSALSRATDWAVEIYNRSPDKFLATDIAKAYGAQLQYDDAVHWARKAVTLDRGATWAWANLGELLARGGDTDSAIEALCTAVNLDRKGDFTGKPRALLASLLARRGDRAWSACEAAAVKDHYERQGWKNVPRDALALTIQPWYASANEEDFDDKQARADAAHRIQLTFFANVRNEVGCYIGEDFKKRPMIARLADGVVMMGLGVRAGKVPRRLAVGTVLQLTVGDDDGKEAIISVQPDETKALWSIIPTAPPPTAYLKQGVLCRFSGTLRKLPKGGGFLDRPGHESIFVDGRVAESASEAETLNVIAEWGLNTKKNVHQWKAIARSN